MSAPITRAPFDSAPAATHSITGWPRVAEHECGARAVLLHSTVARASYECRGTPTEPRSAYGPDGCGAVFEVTP